MPAPFPTRDEIVEFIRESPTRVGKREIARAFNLDAEQKVLLKQVLRELQQDGTVQRGRSQRFAEPGSLPEVALVEVHLIDTDGEVIARPTSWNDEDGPPPRIYMAPERRGHPALAPGDRVLARLKQAGHGAYEGRTIRRIAAAPPRMLGIFDVIEGEARVRPTDRRAKADLQVAAGDSMDAAPGELVRAEILPGKRLGLRRAKVVERLGEPGGVRSVSLIAIHDAEIPTTFPPDAIEQARRAGPAPLGKRTDLRPLPLVTIDGADARDFDDAVWAEPDPEHPDGWHLVVAIADVSWYVRPASPLDRAAFDRGNSVYFPDRVVPMLPEDLSNGWCSLKPDEDRPVLAAHLWIDGAGVLHRHRFERGLMRSAARLTYDEVQAHHDAGTEPLAVPVVAPLFGAYRALARARTARGVLELEMPERRIVLDEAGHVTGVATRERWDSHKLIEEFMIGANVAAAETLERVRQPCMYRIHDEPSREKLDALRDFLESLGLRLARGQVTRPELFNRILDKARDTPHARVVNEVVLRSQAQAEYAPDNIGHFGLALHRYCHFTSPIRRYADLLVHRALIRGLGLGDGGLPDAHGDFEEIGKHISATERRAAGAERSAVDRFTALFLADKVGQVLSGRITGVTRFGLFVCLDDSGGDGLVPVGTLPDDYYVHDEARHELRGRRTNRAYRLGDAVDARLREANPITGGLILELPEGAGETSGRRRRGPGRPPPRMARRSKGKR